MDYTPSGNSNSEKKLGYKRNIEDEIDSSCKQSPLPFHFLGDNQQKFHFKKIINKSTLSNKKKKPIIILPFQ